MTAGAPLGAPGQEARRSRRRGEGAQRAGRTATDRITPGRTSSRAGRESASGTDLGSSKPDQSIETFARRQTETRQENRNGSGSPKWDAKGRSYSRLAFEIVKQGLTLFANA